MKFYSILRILSDFDRGLLDERTLSGAFEIYEFAAFTTLGFY
jgi:hypothetical protein